MAQQSAPNVVSWSATISAFEKGTQWQGAIGLLEVMVHRLLPPDQVSLSAAIGAYGKGEQWEGAPGLLQEMVHQLLAANVVS